MLMKNKTILILLLLTILTILTILIIFFSIWIRYIENLESNSNIKFVTFNEKWWEMDYIKNDLLKDIVNIDNTILIEPGDFTNLYNDDTLVNNSIFLVNDVVPFETIEHVVKKIKPICILHFSDERGNANHWLSLSKYTKLLLRQHNHENYNIDSYGNIIHIPLGYVSTYLNGRSSLDIESKKIPERQYTCSFIGEMKNDREYMCDIFENNFQNTYIKRITNTWKIQSLSYSPPEIFSIYNDSIFVLNGKGNFSIDCFRIYEALIAGAIPVIVGEKNEINRVFYFNDNSLPPFVFADNWNDAVNKCKSLLENKEQLQNLQDANINWYKNKITEIREKIKGVCNK